MQIKLRTPQELDELPEERNVDFAREVEQPADIDHLEAKLVVPLLEVGARLGQMLHEVRQVDFERWDTTKYKIIRNLRGTPRECYETPAYKSSIIKMS